MGAGEVLFLDLHGRLHAHVTPLAQSLQPCIFEWVYLARPDAVMDNISVYEARVQMGIRLAARIRGARVAEAGAMMRVVEAGDEAFGPQLAPLVESIDVVVAVPDTARHTALAVGVEGEVESRLQRNWGRSMWRGCRRIAMWRGRSSCLHSKSGRRASVSNIIRSMWGLAGNDR